MAQKFTLTELECRVRVGFRVRSESGSRLGQKFATLASVKCNLKTDLFKQMYIDLIVFVDM